MENTSGQGKTAAVPGEIDRWNWGAFLMSWIWGIGNNTYIALLMFVPLVNIVMPFVLGAKGSSWAWRNKKWESVEEFKVVQRKWARWSAVAIVLIVSVMVGLFFLLMATIKSSDAFKLAEAKVDSSAQALQLLGEPISTGLPWGNIQISGPSGEAALSFSVEGPRGKGTVYFTAVKELGQWKISQVVLEDESTRQRIDLNQ